MLFLFENTLTHYIYIAQKIHPSTTPPPTATPRHRFKPWRWANHQTMSSAPHHHRPPHLDTSSSRGDGHTLAPCSAHHTDTDRPTSPQPQARGEWHTPHLPGFRIYDKPYLTYSIPMVYSAAVAFFRSRFVQNINSL